MPNIAGSKTKVSTKNTARQKAWTSMRVMRRFTVADIQTTAGIKRDNITRYVSRLLDAGFVRIERDRVNGRPGSYRTYMLVKNHGPLAPIPWRNGQVYDPNTDTAHGEVSHG